MKFNKNMLMLIVGILFIMSVMPGQGQKASDQQALVTTEYTCSAKEQCPVCVGGGILPYNESDSNFASELSYAECIEGKCVMSDSCLVWDCPTGAMKGNETCQSIKKTILDNTVERFNKNPLLLFGIIALIVAFFMLQ